MNPIGKDEESCVYREKSLSSPEPLPEWEKPWRSCLQQKEHMSSFRTFITRGHKKSLKRSRKTAERQSPSKHAVVGLTKNTAYLYANEGIRCNGIAPGAVETNIGQSMTNINDFGMGRTMLGMGLNPRTAQPEEIAKLALFLVSEESSFVNGAIVVADGGWSAY
ncbi:hypothetical protein A3783_05345 [Exiguobacterium undae]|uniref:SDR family oxidoreductase n=1 Tax=Exiguobacterium undae TaxID=169177 RepID=A0ABX2VAX0_9BACL|nr:hypothetical protein A3783_05345 [Exiguobacterium undae]